MTASEESSSAFFCCPAVGLSPRAGYACQQRIHQPLVDARRSSKGFHRVPQAPEVPPVLLHALLLPLSIEKQRLQGLHEVEDVLFMVVEADAYFLHLSNEIM